MAEQYPFQWRHFEAGIIFLCVRWYVRYALSYRDLEEIIAERGLPVDHTTIYRWVQRYAPELEKRCRPHLKATNGSWRVDETYVKVKGIWMYLYRAVDSQGNTLEFHLSVTRNARAAKSFFSKALGATHTMAPRVIAVDKNAAYPKAFDELKAAQALPAGCELRQSKYLNNLIEQDHRFIKRLVKPGYCQLSERMEELAKKKDEGKKRSRRRGVDNAVLCRSFCFGYLVPGLESGL